MITFTRTDSLEIGKDTASWWPVMLRAEQLIISDFILDRENGEQVLIFRDVDVSHAGGSFRSTTMGEAVDAASRSSYDIKRIALHIRNEIGGGAFTRRVMVSAGESSLEPADMEVKFEIFGYEQQAVDGFAYALSSALQKKIATAQGAQADISQPEEISTPKRILRFVANQPLVVQILGSIIAAGVLALFGYLIA